MGQCLADENPASVKVTFDSRLLLPLEGNLFSLLPVADMSFLKFKHRVYYNSDFHLSENFSNPQFCVFTLSSNTHLMSSSVVFLYALVCAILSSGTHQKKAFMTVVSRKIVPQ